MPKKTVVEMVCDRCGRTWYPEVKKDGPEPSAPSAAIVFRDEKGAEVVSVGYEVLCDSCSKTVLNYLSNVGKDLKNKSPLRARKTGKGGEEAVASPPTPPPIPPPAVPPPAPAAKPTVVTPQHPPQPQQKAAGHR